MDRKEFFDSLPIDRYSPEDLRRIQRAYELSKLAHAKQQRDTGERYFNHPRAVATFAIQYGFTDADTICAALLHDGVEDTFLTPDFYIALLGARVWRWVETLSKKIPTFDPLYGNVTGYVKKETNVYFTAIMQLPVGARVIKILDRLHNLMTCEDWKIDRLRRYIEETERHVLPIADATEPKIANAIRDRLAVLRRKLEPAQS